MIDQMMVQGLKQGGLDAEIELYDWTGVDEGLIALAKTQRHDEQSTLVARKIERIASDNPNRPIIITSHSGGTGIAVWALEKLPEDLKIDTLVMIQSALSPAYDLSKALTRVRGKAYAFNSVHDDLVLGAGTRLMGTIDRVKTDAAGRVGFAQPANADTTQYEKLVQVPYDTAWLRLGNVGDHIGPMFRPFSRTIIAPLVLTGQLPALEKLAPSATQPASTSSKR